MTIRTVLFDLDETLFDHSHAARTALARVREAHPALGRRTLQELEVEYQRLLDELHPSVLAGLMTLDQSRSERFRRLCDFCGTSISSGEEQGLSVLYRDAYAQARRALPGAIPLLEALRGRVSTGIVTNNLTEEQREKMLVTGMDHLIDFLVTSEGAGAQKPDIAIFREALRRAGCRADEAVMVGDSWQADIVGAAHAGIRAIWLNRRGAMCPDPSLAIEIRSFEPLERVLGVILGSG